jgi:hypothetical protein
MKSLYLFFIGLFFVTAGGWIANIVKFIGLLHSDVNGMFIARIIGIFAVPLGAILGYF